MACVLNKPTTNFTQISNHILNDINLSLKAKGLISFMLSKPDKWKFSIQTIAQQCREGQSLVRAALKELQQNKYLKTFPVKNSKGVIQRWEYHLSHYPVDAFPQVGNPLVGNPLVEKQHASNKEKSKTDEERKKQHPPREGIEKLVHEIKTARPEFSIMQDMAIENELRNAKAEGHDIEKHAQEFIAHMANALYPPQLPLKTLINYLNHTKRKGRYDNEERTIKFE